MNVNQIAHFLAGLVGVFGPVACFGSRAKWWGTLGILTLAAVKEFLFDGVILHVQGFWGAGGSLEDFAFFAFGAVIALWLYHLSQDIKSVK